MSITTEFVWFNITANGCVYETFGISKRFSIKLQLLLIRAETLDKPLTAKCFIHVVSVSLFIFPVILSFIFAALSFCPCVWVGKLFGWFWTCVGIFERPANVLDYEVWAIQSIVLFYSLLCIQYLQTR